jgi:mitochondrial import inner membrane translocase subunit TIM23
MEASFFKIGLACMTGGAVGGLGGLYNGFRHTQQLKGAVRRTQSLNYITKQGASSAQAFGSFGN